MDTHGPWLASTSVQAFLLPQSFSAVARSPWGRVYNVIYGHNNKILHTEWSTELKWLATGFCSMTQWN